jgi:membrane peptidoglycan carboxypeptidase
LISDILADDASRSLGFGRGGVLKTNYRASVKTGTSANFKDNWRLGYTDKYVVGVWAGNFASRPMDRISGVNGAGELWREVMDLLELRNPASPRIIVPSGLSKVKFCPLSGLPAGPDCPNVIFDYFLSEKPLPPKCDHRHDGLLTANALGNPQGFALLSPKSREIYALDPGLSSSQNRIRAEVQITPNLDELVWTLNGEELSRESVHGKSRSHMLIPLRKGKNLLKVTGLGPGGEETTKAAGYEVR